MELNKFADTVNISSHPHDLMNIQNIPNTNSMLRTQNVSTLKDPLPSKTIWNTTILSKVKNQGGCGSCWAFSTTSSIESHMRIRQYKVHRLFEQQLVDCSTQNNGCNGGLMHLAFEYCIDNNGLVSDSDYTYTASEKECALNCDVNKNMSIHLQNVPGSNITGYMFTMPRSAISLMMALQHGPVSIAIDASSFVFRFYKNGVIDIPANQSFQINHAVLLTGYDKDENGTYWIIQNSWGTDWGNHGYAKIRVRNGDGVLLSHLYGVYPLFE